MSNYAAGIDTWAICGRCQLRYPYRKIVPDGNSPGLRVCTEGCYDTLDPYRLPKHQPEAFVVQFPRPDVPLEGNPLGILNTPDETIYLTTDDGEEWLQP